MADKGQPTFVGAGIHDTLELQNNGYFGAKQYGSGTCLGACAAPLMTMKRAPRDLYCGGLIGGVLCCSGTFPIRPLNRYSYSSGTCFGAAFAVKALPSPKIPSKARTWFSQKAKAMHPKKTLSPKARGTLGGSFTPRP